MELTRLGRTDLMVTRTSFGVLPLQRVEMEEATRILRKAFDAGINFYDTARSYTDSEEKIGYALSDVRDSIIIATKTPAATRSEVLADLEVSLRNLKTDYIDILQLHNPNPLPDPEDSGSSYAGLVEARERGMVRFIGLSSHSLERATAAVASGLYDTLQYPISHISTPADLSVIDQCYHLDVGLIGMKPLSGGLITNARPAFAFLRKFENLVPIWGIQRMSELEQILEFDANPPELDAEMWALVNRDREELAGDFCRACGYCLPCSSEIPIPMAARMSLLLRRMPWQQFMSDKWHQDMHRIESCTDCGHCREHCPYGLDTPTLLRKMLADYKEFYSTHAELVD
ncbi:MAG TPA: aldo/keto reductase [Armatimonadota bacterium]|nr:aldo/keto reductase [Armatimonadota bacterium]